MSNEKLMCPTNFKKLVKRFDALVKRVNALENITLTKLFRNIEPSTDSLKIQYGDVLLAFNPNNKEELKFVNRFFDQFIGDKEDTQ